MAQWKKWEKIRNKFPKMGIKLWSSTGLQNSIEGEVADTQVKTELVRALKYSQE